MDLRQSRIPLILLALLTGILYANSLGVSFQFDDATSIVNNRAVHELDPASWWSFWPGRILTYATFALDYSVHQNAVWGYHLFNIVVHLFAGFGVFFLVLGLMPKLAPNSDARWTALAATTLFLAHPLQTQAVTYIVQRATSLCYAFYLWALVFHLNGRRRQEEGRSSRAMTAGALVCAMAAGLSKEVVVSLPVAALLVEAAAAGPGGKIRWRQLLLMALVAWGVPLMAIVMGGSHFGVAGGALTAETKKVSRLDYALTQVHAVAHYLRLTLIPLGQTVDADLPWRHWPASLATSLLLLLHLSLWSVAFVLWRKGQRLWAFCILWFYLLLAPTSSFFPIRDPLFEHRVYGALLGPSLAAAALLETLRQNRPRLARFALVTVLLALGGSTVQRNRVWATPVSLWEDAVRKGPAKSRPHVAYGVALGGAGRLDEAIRELSIAVRLSPDYAKAWNNLGQAKIRRGDESAGISALKRAVQLDPKSVSAWYNLAVAENRQKDLAAAENSFRKTLELQPRHAAALNGLAVVRLQRGDPVQARDLARRASTLGKPEPGLIKAIEKALSDSSRR